MLKIHKLNSKKLLIISITSILGIGVLLGFSALTYTPELSHAETATSKKTINDITYMQEMTPEICANMKEADANGNFQYQLKDSRDQKTYWVAKLKDGNCWMTQNLSIINKTIDSTDSDIKTGSFIIPASASTGFSSSDTYTPKAYYDTIYGGYYNWYTATAGYRITRGDAATSICPKNWQLPSSSGNKSFITLFTSYGTNIKNTLQYGNQIITNPPLNFTYGGNIMNGTKNNANVNGYYWSSTADYPNSTSMIWSLTFASTNATSAYASPYVGISVRCVARTESIPNNNVEITVNNTISLDVASEIEIKKAETNPSVANFDVKVSSNQPYKLQLSSTNPNLTSSTTSTTIPSKSGALNTSTNAWGIKLTSSSTYSQITSTPTTFYTASGAEVKTIPFTIGISTAPDLPAAEYSTNITVTATQN